jgi:hypothetical protein
MLLLFGIFSVILVCFTKKLWQPCPGHTVDEQQRETDDRNYSNVALFQSGSDLRGGKPKKDLRGKRNDFRDLGGTQIKFIFQLSSPPLLLYVTAP